jgi:hypothetical protein
MRNYRLPPIQLRIAAGRHGYALRRAHPHLTLKQIADQLLADRALGMGPGQPYRTKRLRRLIDAYARCVERGIEPMPETIFDL